MGYPPLLSGEELKFFIISRYRQLCLCSPPDLSPENQRWFLDNCIDGHLASLFPPGIDFERKTLRACVLAVEEAGLPLSDELMEAFSRRLSAGPPASPNEWSYKLYSYAPAADPFAARKAALEGMERSIAGAGQPVTAGGCQYGLIALHTSRNLISGGTGRHDWDAGYFLAEYVLNRHQLFSGRSCLELGCGTGGVGVALARAGAAAVLCTDGNAETLSNCEHNLALNGVQLGAAPAGGPAVRCKRLEWEDGVAGLRELVAEGRTAAGNGEIVAAAWPDVAVGADLLYDPLNIPPLLGLLKPLLGAGGRAEESKEESNGFRPIQYALLATTKRNEATLQEFVDKVEADAELCIEDVTAEADARGVRFCHLADLEAGARERIVLHRLTFMKSNAA